MSARTTGQCRSPWCENNGRWTFDTKAGAQTIIDRRIGRNELSAIRTLLASVDAQRDYFERAKQATGSGEFATRMLSTPGRRDGLYWSVSEGEPESPLGPLIDAAQDAGYPGELVGGKFLTRATISASSRRKAQTGMVVPRAMCSPAGWSAALR